MRKVPLSDRTRQRCLFIRRLGGECGLGFKVFPGAQQSGPSLGYSICSYFNPKVMLISSGTSQGLNHNFLVVRVSRSVCTELYELNGFRPKPGDIQVIPECLMPLALHIPARSDYTWV